MRAAPAVSALLDDCRPERVLIALLYGGACAAVAAWAGALVLVDGAVALLPVDCALLGLLVGGAAGWRLAHWLLPQGMASLGWDGQAWSLSQRTSAGVALVTPLTVLYRLIDLGPWLLLRGHFATGQPRWLVVRERRARADWHLLRVALMAHARGLR